MHHWTVPVAINVRLEALEGVAPSDFAHFLTRKAPIFEAGELLAKSLCHLCVHKIYECISKPRAVLKVNWKVDEVESLSITLCNEKINQHLTGVVIG